MPVADSMLHKAAMMWWSYQMYNFNKLKSDTLSNVTKNALHHVHLVEKV